MDETNYVTTWFPLKWEYYGIFLQHCYRKSGMGLTNEFGVHPITNLFFSVQGCADAGIPIHWEISAVGSHLLLVEVPSKAGV